MIQAKVKHTFATALQFEIETGTGHKFLIDDAIGKTGPKPIERMRLESKLISVPPLHRYSPPCGSIMHSPETI
jgi:hypothetical protein